MARSRRKRTSQSRVEPREHKPGPWLLDSRAMRDCLRCDKRFGPSVQRLCPECRADIRNRISRERTDADDDQTSARTDGDWVYM